MPTSSREHNSDFGVLSAPVLELGRVYRNCLLGGRSELPQVE